MGRGILLWFLGVPIPIILVTLGTLLALGALGSLAGAGVRGAACATNIT